MGFELTRRAFLAATAAAVLVVPKAAGANTLWHWFTVEPPWADWTLHAYVDEPSEEAALRRLQADDPLWSKSDLVWYHGLIDPYFWDEYYESPRGGFIVKLETDLERAERALEYERCCPA